MSEFRKFAETTLGLDLTATQKKILDIVEAKTKGEPLMLTQCKNYHYKECPDPDRCAPNGLYCQNSKLANATVVSAHSDRPGSPLRATNDVRDSWNDGHKDPMLNIERFTNMTLTMRTFGTDEQRRASIERMKKELSTAGFNVNIQVIAYT